MKRSPHQFCCCKFHALWMCMYEQCSCLFACKQRLHFTCQVHHLACAFEGKGFVAELRHTWVFSPPRHVRSGESNAFQGSRLRLQQPVREQSELKNWQCDAASKSRLCV